VWFLAACTLLWAVPALAQEPVATSTVSVDTSNESRLAQPDLVKPFSVFDLNFALGIGFGGERIAAIELTDGSQQTLEAGRGILLTLGGKVTPLWLGNLLGLGIGLDFGWKTGAVTASDASMSLTRIPLVATAHAVLRLSPHWHLLAATGVDYDMNVAFRGTGRLSGLSADASNAFGPLVEGGFLYIQDHVGFDMRLRYTSMTYEFPGGNVDASHFDILLTGHFLF
jgi:hypothetical protein